MRLGAQVTPRGLSADLAPFQSLSVRCNSICILGRAATNHFKKEMKAELPNDR
jgi:hypothetical protein